MSIRNPRVEISPPMINSAGQTIVGPVSYEEFLDWTDEDTHAEWVDGEIEMSSPASGIHQDIEGFLYELLNTFVKMNDLGKVRLPFQMKTARGREPDLIFVAKARLNLIRRTFLDGPADLAVEIVSPESRQRDRVTKVEEYAQAGVGEFWLIDPLESTAHFFQLDEQHTYRETELDAEGHFHSTALPGFWLNPAWLWQEPLPDAEDALLEIAGETYSQYLLQRLRRRGLLPPEQPAPGLATNLGQAEDL